ncbi:hypothetical protein KIH74_30150 [Kineosporia sp. J2-2]|uniref:PKD domain-containing protein n=1 Tax=Kineosporia corallincola TaxID=2835133 RepID=A0ABS5TQF4_9ACTN|nr:hypothetical protein [Kineosporia corallincola]MBT0773245.1 hypothetical protein [Kineosporia corallincola]
MAAIVSTVLVIVSAGVSTADSPVDCVKNAGWIADCGLAAADPAPQGDGEQETSTGGSERVCIDLNKQKVPCTSEYGTWLSSRSCYAKLLDPQPAKNSEVWDGHDTGGIYSCAGVDGLGIGVYAYFWMAEGPGPAVDPEELARQALAQMGLKAITIGMTPEPGAGRVGLVGLPNWLWAENPNVSTVGPITKSVTAGSVTVTATAELDRIVWDMGDGETVVCHGAGTPYEDSDGKSSSPDCGHTYDVPGTYSVTATSYWTVSWSGAGQTGEIPLQLERTADSVVIGEAQVVTQ